MVMAENHSARSAACFELGSEALFIYLINTSLLFESDYRLSDLDNDDNSKQNSRSNNIMLLFLLSEKARQKLHPWKVML